MGAVSYLNTKPLIYGLEKGMMKDDIELVLDFPANIANMLLNDEIDMGLVPVAIIPRLKESHILTNYGICCNGPVASVCLFSDVPLEEITTVLLDYQSKTSVRLAKILLKEYWKIEPDFLETAGDFHTQIKGTTAAVVIGDRALAQRNHSKYVYDLGEAWKAFTGLPFVFAAWVSNKVLDEKFIAAFNAVNQYGLDHLADVIRENQNNIYSMEDYFYKNIDYKIDDFKKEGLNLFLKYI